MRVVYVSSKYNNRRIALADAHPDDLVLLLDMDRCIGCGACRMACQIEHGESLDAQARRIALEKSSDGPGKLLSLPTGCWNCANACTYAGSDYWTICPQEKTGGFNGALCDCCADRVALGLTPACATRCAMKCLHIGRVADIRFALEEKRLRNMGEAEFLP